MVTYNVDGELYIDFYGVRQLINIPKSSLIKLLSCSNDLVITHEYKNYKLYKFSDVAHLKALKNNGMV